MPFYNDTPSRHNIVISFTPNPRYDFAIFAKGYHLAAKQLADSFLLKVGFGDHEGYPIVFLYRQAFELHLKNIIYWAARLGPFKDIHTIDRKLYNTHRLSDLSQVATALLSRLFPTESDVPEWNRKITQYAREFDQIDPTSFSYRYPIDKDGRPSTKHHQVVSILSLYRNMETLLDILESINYGLAGETDQAEAAYEILHDFSLN